MLSCFYHDALIWIVWALSYLKKKELVKELLVSPCFFDYCNFKALVADIDSLVSGEFVLNAFSIKVQIDI